MLRFCAVIIALGFVSAGHAAPDSAFSPCEGSKRNGAVARHIKTKTDVRFSTVEMCRNQIESQFPVDVVCGCTQTLGGAQIFMAIFTAGASLATARQWNLELQCHSYSEGKLQLVKAVEYGRYEADTDQGQALLGQCKAAEQSAFLEFAAGS